ncbi:MAG: ATP-dependent helicase, partial [Deltaproteobacteria bacterium]
MEKYFSENGILARHLNGFEARQGQRVMAEAVSRTLSGGALLDELSGPLAGVLVAEAETGIGKTLAYLIPAILSGKKIVVSTATINLQDQILKKDIPLVEKALGIDTRALCVKGRQNYLCLYRWYQHQANPQLGLVKDADAERISKWLQVTQTGDRAELDWLPDKSVFWNRISSNSNNCLGSDCSEYSHCFVNQLRKMAAKAGLLIVNHHLLFSDLALRKGGHGEVLPRYEAVIFDEAHHLENVATNFFGKSVSQYQLIDFFADVERQAEVDLSLERLDSLINELRGAKKRVELFAALFPAARGRYPLRKLRDELGEVWRQEAEALSAALVRIGDKLEKYSKIGEVWHSLADRAFELDKNLTEVALPEEFAKMQGYVYWYERRERSVSISCTPIKVADEFEQTLFSKVDSCVLTSATLSSGESFDYIQQRLGLPEHTEFLQLKSPFDYRKRTRLYVPGHDFPAPQAANYQTEVCRKILELIKLAGGKTLVLFTSFKAMDAAAEYLEGKICP